MCETWPAHRRTKQARLAALTEYHDAHTTRMVAFFDHLGTRLDWHGDGHEHVLAAGAHGRMMSWDGHSAGLRL